MFAVLGSGVRARSHVEAVGDPNGVGPAGGNVVEGPQAAKRVHQANAIAQLLAEFTNTIATAQRKPLQAKPL